MESSNGRPKNLGKLLVVGGYGGSGATTIAKMLSRNFSLNRIYAGGLMRKRAKAKGYDNVKDYLKSLSPTDLEKIDKEIDNSMVRYSYLPNVLIDSKIFSALATKYNIPATVKIWINCDMQVRAKRKALKDGLNEADVLKSLEERYVLDKERFERMYNIDYSSPKKYNDIVINSSRLNEAQTLNLILKLIKDGRYITE